MESSAGMTSDFEPLDPMTPFPSASQLGGRISQPFDLVPGGALFFQWIWLPFYFNLDEPNWYTYIVTWRLRESLFVLIANAPEHSAQDALMAYKQQTAVEPDHHILKDPLGEAPVFLKDPDKIIPDVYLVSMTVLIWQVMQAVARRNAGRWGVSLPYPNGK
jgi:hypothetical protein